MRFSCRAASHTTRTRLALTYMRRLQNLCGRRAFRQGRGTEGGSSVREEVVEDRFRLDDAGMRVADDALGRHHHELDSAHPQIPSSISLNLPECWKFPEIPGRIRDQGGARPRRFDSRGGRADSHAPICMVMFLGRDALPEKMIYSEGTPLDMTAGRPGRGHASP